MKTGTKIGLFAAFTAIGTGAYLAWRVSTPTPKNRSEKVDDETNYIPLEQERIKASLKESKTYNNDKYAKDLKRFGTKQGVLDVANDELAKKKKKKRSNSIANVGASIGKRSLKTLLKARGKANLSKKPTGIAKYQDYLLEEFNKTQITLANTSTETRTIRLWGDNKDAPISPVLVTDVEDHALVQNVSVPSNIGVGNQPQRLAYNPSNNLVYVANQLSDNVSVIDRTGQVLTVIQLEPTVLPGSNSPVAIAINTNQTSSTYGMVYVAGSVANTISVIDATHTVIDTIDVGVRPIDIAFNPTNEQLYVSNFGSNNVSVIDPNSLSVIDTLNVQKAPVGIGVNFTNGDVYIANSSSDSISVFDNTNNAITTITPVGTRPVSVTYHPLNNEVYVVATESNAIYPINTTTYALGAAITTGNTPFASVFNPANELLYVGNKDDETFTLIAPDHSIRATISLGINVNNDFIFHPNENQIWVTDTDNNSVNIIGYQEQSSAITINDGYDELSQNFLYNPAIVKHVKWVLSGEERFNVLRLVKETPTGTQKSTAISHENYRSPQNFLNVSEMTALDGTTIDGKNSWWFEIGGLQTITLMVYYRQIQFSEHLPTPQKIAV